VDGKTGLEVLWLRKGLPDAEQSEEG
jgi:hypothetical protein